MSASVLRVRPSLLCAKFGTKLSASSKSVRLPWRSLASLAKSSFRPRTITGTNAGSADTIQLVRYAKAVTVSAGTCTYLSFPQLF